MSLILLRILQFLIGFVGIGLIVLVHEAGHFIAARLLGVRVEVFGLGMGPKLFSWQGKKTEYRLSLIPFGGYCRMEGSIDLIKALRDDEKSFSKGEYGSYFTTSPLVRLIIFLSGPFINFLLSCLLFVIVAWLPADQAVHEARLVLVSDYPTLFNTDLEQPDLQSGDIITSVDGFEVSWFEDASGLIASSDKEVLPLTILREGAKLQVNAYGIANENGGYSYGIAVWEEPVIGRVEDTDLFKVGDRIVSVNGAEVKNSYDFYLCCGEEMDIVIIRDGEMVEVIYPSSENFPFAWAAELVPLPKAGFFEAMKKGFVQSYEAIKDTFGMLANIFNLSGEEVRNEITGPTRAAQAIGNITTLGFRLDPLSGLRAFLYLLALVSISLCVANLIPIPAFDGGGALINLVQLITRKEMKPRSYVVFQIVGIMCTAAILFAMYYQDLKHYFF